MVQFGDNPTGPNELERSDKSFDLTTGPFRDDHLPAKFGRYELLRLLGVGGMGSVYLAEDSALQRQVALKIPNRSLDKPALHRFLEEARSAAKINHPNVCSLYDIGCEQNRPYLTMEYIEGSSLDQFVAPDKPMAPLTAAKIVIKIAAGLHAAHSRGVIHRDLKPANILMRDRAQPVITDFGLAYRNDTSVSGQRPGKILGSPAYMAPEQVRGDLTRIDETTDVYGLGTILYELITGRRPFDGQVPVIYSQVLTEKPPTPSDVVSGIDPRLDEICLRALSKNPDDRFGDVISLSQTLVRYMQDPQPRPRLDDRPVVLSEPCVLKPVASTQVTRSAAARRPTNPRSSRGQSQASWARRWHRRVVRYRAEILTGISICSVICLTLLVGLSVWSNVVSQRALSSLIQESNALQRGSQASAEAVPATPPARRDANRETTASAPLPHPGSEPFERVDAEAPSVPSTAVVEAVIQAVRQAETKLVDQPIRFAFSQSIDWDAAVVKLNGKRLESHEISGPISLAVGSHHLSIASPEVESISHHFDVSLPSWSAGGSPPVRTIELPLVRRVGKIQFRVLRLAQADSVRLDGRQIPLSQLTQPIVLPVGRHHMDIACVGMPVKRKIFWVIEGKNPDLNITVKSPTLVDFETAELLALQDHGRPPEAMDLPLKAGELRADNVLGMQMAWCPSNARRSGPPTDAAKRSSGYWVGRFEITMAQWKLIRSSTPWIDTRAEQARASRHAHTMSWKEAMEFAAQLTQIERARGNIDSRWQYTLPTQDQWELAIRAETQSSVQSRMRSNRTTLVANVADHQEGGFNRWGIYHRRGDVREWCRGECFQRAAPISRRYNDRQVGFRLVLVPVDHQAGG